MFACSVTAMLPSGIAQTWTMPSGPGRSRWALGGHLDAGRRVTPWGSGQTVFQRGVVWYFNQHPTAESMRLFSNPPRALLRVLELEPT